MSRDEGHLDLLFDILGQGIILPETIPNLLPVYNDWIIRGSSLPKCYLNGEEKYDAIVLDQLSCIFGIETATDVDSAILSVISLFKDLPVNRPLSGSMWKHLLQSILKSSEKMGGARVHSRRLYDVMMTLFSGSLVKDVDLWTEFVSHCRGLPPLTRHHLTRGTSLPLEDLSEEDLIFAWYNTLKSLPFCQDEEGKEFYDVVNQNVSPYCRGLEVICQIFDSFSLIKKPTVAQSESFLTVFSSRSDVLRIFGPWLFSALGISSKYLASPFDESGLSCLDDVDDHVVAVGVKLLSRVCFKTDDSRDLRGNEGFLYMFLGYCEALLHRNCFSPPALSVLVNLFPLYNGILGDLDSESNISQNLILSMIPAIIFASSSLLSNVVRLQTIVESGQSVNRSFPSMTEVVGSLLRQIELSFDLLLSIDLQSSSTSEPSSPNLDICGTFRRVITTLYDFSKDSNNSKFWNSSTRTIMSVFFTTLSKFSSFIPSSQELFSKALIELSDLICDLLTNSNENLITTASSVFELCCPSISTSPCPTVSRILSSVFSAFNDCITIMIIKLNEKQFIGELIYTVFSSLIALSLKFPFLLLSNRANLDHLLGNVQLLASGETALIKLSKFSKISNSPKSVALKVPEDFPSAIFISSLQLLLATLRCWPMFPGQTFLGTNVEDVLPNSCVRHVSLSGSSVVTFSETSSRSRVTVRNCVGKFSFEVSSVNDVTALPSIQSEFLDVPCAASSSSATNVIDFEPIASQVQFDDDLASFMDDIPSELPQLSSLVNTSIPDISNVKSQGERVIRSVLATRKSDDSQSNIDWDVEFESWKALLPNMNDSDSEEPRLQNSRLLLVSLGLLHPIAASSSRVQSIEGNSKFVSELSTLDSISARSKIDVTVSFGVKSQRSLDAFIGNTDVSKSFVDFVHSLGWVIDLENHVGYTGSLLDSSPAESVYFANETLEIFYYVLPQLQLTPPEKLTVSRMAPIQILYADCSSIIPYTFESFSPPVLSPVTKLVLVVSPTCYLNRIRVGCVFGNNVDYLKDVLAPVYLIESTDLGLFLRQLISIATRCISKSFTSSGLLSRSIKISEISSKFAKPVDSVEVLCNFLSTS
ncbi:hypothetical protein GEMRC1_004034 [Eukaryota sp. GEM-RC1]